MQSKRLYPKNASVVEESRGDYEIGIARIADPEILAQSITSQTEFEFNEKCRYGALILGSDQAKAIAKYEQKNELSVYYQFYNPQVIPFVRRVPITEYEHIENKLPLGTRIIPVGVVHKHLSDKKKGHKPSIGEIKDALEKPYRFGWPLEHFVVNLFLKCQEGSLFERISDDRIQNLFYRRSGPIAAAISIKIEVP